MSSSTPTSSRRVPLAVVPVITGVIVVASVVFAGCGSSKSTATNPASTVGPAASTDTSGATTGSSADTTTGGTAGSSSASGLPDACTLLTGDEMNTVLKGADGGTRQLSQCVWTDREGTAARLVISQPKAGSSLDTSVGKPLSGVGDAAVISSSPGSVKIDARAKGFDIFFSVDTGTQDIKPNQDNAVVLVKKAVGRLP